VKLSLRLDADRLISTWTNDGTTPVALAFWWNRRLVVADQHGALVQPGPGPVLPCGVMEDWTELAPGASFERDESLACTQPAGRSEAIGWSYELKPGTWKVSLRFEAPPAHGFSQSAPHPHAFTGKLESNSVELVVAEKPRGLLSRLFSRD
jgi:hypothetical protein